MADHEKLFKLLMFLCQAQDFGIMLYNKQVRDRAICLVPLWESKTSTVLFINIASIPTVKPTNYFLFFVNSSFKLNVLTLYQLYRITLAKAA